MREIKFRAWDNHDKIMMWCPSGPVGEFVFTRSAGGNAIETIPFKVVYYQLVWPQPKQGIHFYKSRYVLMQYTGLKDKNGVEIYEDDIMDSPQGILKCSWDDVESRFVMHSFTAVREFMSQGKLEVIGNIYENPELLK